MTKCQHCRRPDEAACRGFLNQLCPLAASQISRVKRITQLRPPLMAWYRAVSANLTTCQSRAELDDHRRTTRHLHPMHARHTCQAAEELLALDDGAVAHAFAEADLDGFGQGACVTFRGEGRKLRKPRADGTVGTTTKTAGTTAETNRSLSIGFTTAPPARAPRSGPAVRAGRQDKGSWQRIHRTAPASRATAAGPRTSIQRRQRPCRSETRPRTAGTFRWPR